MAIVTVSTVKGSHRVRFAWDEQHDQDAAQNYPRVRDAREAVVLWAQILHAQGKKVPAMCHVTTVETDKDTALNVTSTDYTTPTVPYNEAIDAIGMYFSQQNKETEENNT